MLLLLIFQNYIEDSKSFVCNLEITNDKYFRGGSRGKCGFTLHLSFFYSTFSIFEMKRNGIDLQYYELNDIIGSETILCLVKLLFNVETK